MQDKVYQMLMNEDEITWQTLIYELVKTEEMNPWDIDISQLCAKYIEAIQELQEHNFFISGKVVLAASILLKLKSFKLVDEDIADFDNLLFHREEDLLSDEIEEGSSFQKDIPPLLIKTPQARKRKINLNDLISALQQALEVENRRVIRRRDEQVLRVLDVPVRKIDISSLIKNLYSRIREFFQKQQKITFTQLLPSQKKEDKLATFVPLLHLASQGKINIEQEIPFGEIEITAYEEKQ